MIIKYQRGKSFSERIMFGHRGKIRIIGAIYSEETTDSLQPS